MSTNAYFKTQMTDTDTDDTIDRLFDILLQRFQQALVTSHDRGSGFTHKNVALLCYYFQKIDILRAKSYIMSPEWIVNNFSIKL